MFFLDPCGEQKSAKQKQRSTTETLQRRLNALDLTLIGTLDVIQIQERWNQTLVGSAEKNIKTSNVEIPYAPKGEQHRP